MRKFSQSAKIRGALAATLAAAMLLGGCAAGSPASSSASSVQSDVSAGKTEEASFQFRGDDRLKKYLDKGLLEKVATSPVGACGPYLCLVTPKYVCVHDYNGVLIYNASNGKLKNVIDIVGLGFKVMQGDNALEVVGNKDYLVLHNVLDSYGYVYSFQKDALERLKDVKAVKVPRMTQISEENIRAARAGRSDMRENIGNYGGLQSEDARAIFYVDYNHVGNSTVWVLDADNRCTSRFFLAG